MDRAHQYHTGSINGEYRRQYCADLPPGDLQWHPYKSTGTGGNGLFSLDFAWVYGGHGDAAGNIWAYLRHVRACSALQHGLRDLLSGQHFAVVDARDGQYRRAGTDSLPP